MPIGQHTPARILELQKFGVGIFSSQEITQKTAFVKGLMMKRPAPKQPRISVVLPAYKEEKYFLATLRSLAEQTFLDCEFIIVSNGEPAGNPTQKICEASGFRVLHNPIAGISRARQTGLKAALGEIVVTTDADTLHNRGWLDRIAKIMSNPNILCGAGLIRPLSDSLAIQWAFKFIAWTIKTKNAINPRLVTSAPEANAFYRRKAALACGGYDPNVRVGEGHMLFKKFYKPGPPLIFTHEEMYVYTSARRLEKRGAMFWLALMTYNTSLQLLGKKGVDQSAYPDIR